VTPSKAKNNHFVPQSYLRRFKSLSDKQVALYNIKSGKTIPGAPIRSQCSRDYFYTKDRRFEDEFGRMEGRQAALLNQLEGTKQIPAAGSRDHHDLLSVIMLQAGRTVSNVAHADHLLNGLGKAMLRHHFEREGNTELLEYLPKVQLNTIDGVMDSISHHLTMYPLLSDLECTLIQNGSGEDFLTSDHPVALCNSMPARFAALGYASRGLIVLYPLSPRSLLILSDSEIYMVASRNGCLTAQRAKDVIDLNLMQFGNANENVYFADPARVERTLETFRRREDILRPSRPAVSEANAILPDNRRATVLKMDPITRRLSLPRGIDLRRAARTGKFRNGDGFVRNPLLVDVVQSETARIDALRRKATEQAKLDKPGGA